MTQADLDQGGNLSQLSRVYRGPSLGWRNVYVKPSTTITAAGTYTIAAGDSVILVNVAASVTIQLPSVATWLKEQFDQFRNAFDGGIWIKDLGGNAAAFPITVARNGTDKIDNLVQNFTIVQNRQLLKMYPLFDQSGWYSG